MQKIMLILFWVLTGILIICAFGFILPWIQGWRIKIFMCTLLTCISYILYLNLGRGLALIEYYSEQGEDIRFKQTEMRPLLTTLHKREFLLRQRIEERPDDVDAKWQLMEVLGIKALEAGQLAEAQQYWDLSLKLMPETADRQVFRGRILRLKERVDAQ